MNREGSLHSFPKPTDTSFWRNETFLAIVLIGLALVLRLLDLSTESAWIDEAFSIALARHTLPEIVRGTIADQHPPLYYFLLHFWLKFGISVTYARLLSVVFGVINVAQGIILGKRLGGPKLGLAGGLFLAVSPGHIWYSQEVRMYILLAVLTTAASIALWDALHKKGLWLTYALFAILAIYTQYFAGFVFIAHGLIVLVWVFRERRLESLLRWTVSMAGVCAAFAPWIPVALNQTRSHPVSWIEALAISEVRDTILRLILGSLILGLPEWMRWLGLSAVGVIFVYVAYRIYRDQIAGFEIFEFLSLWVIVPIGVVAALSFIQTPIFQYKQFIILLVPVLLLAAWITQILPRSTGMSLFVALLFSAIVSQTYQAATLNKDNWRAATETIEASFQPGDVIFANPAASQMALELYWTEPLPFEGYPPDYDLLSGGWNGNLLTPEIADQELEKLKEHYQRIWFVEFYPQFWDPNLSLEHWLNLQSTLLEDISYGKLRLRLYKTSDQIP